MEYNMNDPFQVEVRETFTITKAMMQEPGIVFTPGDLDARMEGFRKECFRLGATLVSFSADSMRGTIRVTVGGPCSAMSAIKALAPQDT